MNDKLIMKEKLINLLNEIKLGVEYENHDDLVSGGFFTSLEIVRLVMLIQEEFEVSISPLQIVPENFESVDAILNLILIAMDE